MQYMARCYYYRMWNFQYGITSYLWLPFQDKQPVEDVRVREWLLKILLFTRIQKDGIDLFSKALPPYKPQEEIDFETIELGDEYFGHTQGSKKLMFSLCGFSDFHRYILGFNSNSESRIYTQMQHDQKRKSIYVYPSFKLQSMVAQKNLTF